MDLHEPIEVTERGQHQASLSTVERDVICQAVRFPGGAITRQRANRALSDAVRGSLVLVQLREDGSERLTAAQLLRGLRDLSVHVDHEASVCRKEGHLSRLWSRDLARPHGSHRTPMLF